MSSERHEPCPPAPSRPVRSGSRSPLRRPRLVHHMPEYSSADHGSDPDTLRVRQFVVPIWQQFHVDMAFAGHDHDYERSYPLAVGSDVDNPTQTTDAQGTTFVVCAGSGADGYTSAKSSWTAVSKDYVSGGGWIGFYSILRA